MKAILCVLPVLATSLQVDFSDTMWRKSPIQKVVGLLKEMQSQIEKEGAEDAELQEQMGCWCETNDREKTKAIADADARIRDLTAKIPELAAKAASLEVEIKSLNKEVAANTESLAKATEVRAKEQEEFRTNSKDMISSLASLKNAVGVMSKVHKDALSQESLAQIRSVLKHQVSKYHLQSLSVKQHEVVLSLLQGPQHVSMIQQNSRHKAPSSAIFGILKQMKEEFETNIVQSEKEEEEAVATFKSLKATKQQEIKAGEDLVETKTVEMADANEKNAQSKVDLEDTNEQFKADKEFLSNLKLKCQNADHEYELRQKTRSEELTAVSEALAIVTDDDAKDLFNSAGHGVSLIQKYQRTSLLSTADRAARAVRKAASKAKNPRLMALAMSMRLDAFAKVKENIDNMVKALKDEQKEEVKQKDYCVGEFNSNEKQTAEKSTLKDDLTQTLADLGNTIESLTEAIATANAEIADTQTEMKKASQNREAQNKAYQLTVNDQRATQTILKKALDKLEGFYKAAASAALVQEGQEPPPSGEYKKSGASSGVMAMIETIIDESKAIEAEAIQAEKDAQAGYETFMKDATASIEALSKDVTNKSKELAKAESDKAATDDDLKHTIDDMLTLGEYGQELHKKCDFLVNNFNLRQESRTEEIEALNSAKAIFSGAK